MTNLLIRLFIKNHQNTQDTAVRAAYGKLSGWVGIVCNTLLCGGKFIAGYLSGSVSIIADAANNLSDASSSIISLLGFKLSEKSADDEHPYGHARYEYLSGLIIAFLVLLIGFELLKSGIDTKTLDSLKKNKNITVATLEKLCTIIGCTPNEIVRFR